MGFVASLIISLVIMVVGELLRPKQSPPDAQASSLDDFSFPTASETRNWPWMAGKCLVEGGNVTWYGDLSAVPVKKRVKTGLWSSKNVTIAHQYYLGVEMFLCVGPVDNVSEVRFGGDAPNIYTRSETTDNIVFNFNDPNFFGGNEKDGGVVGTIRIHKGTDTQNANSYLQAAIGRTRSAYRGLCFAVLEKLYVGTRENIKPISFVAERYPNTLAVSGGKHRVGDDANAICAIYELLTDQRWGGTIPSTEIDLDNFRAIAGQLYDEGMGISMLINSSRTAKDAVAEILRHIDGVMYSDSETGLLTIAIARDDYDIETLEEYGPSDISSFSFSRGSWATTKNTLMLNFIDRDQDFSPRAIPIRENGNIHVRNGQIAAEEVDFLGFSNPTTTLKRGMVALKTMSYPLMSAKIVMNGRGWKLRPGSVFKLNWPAEGISNAVMRVVRINYGDIVRNRIELDCIEDIFAIASTAYVIPPPSQWVNPVGPPQPLVAQYGFEVPYQLVPQEARYAAAMGARFSGIDEGFEIWNDPAGGTSFVKSGVSSEFTPTAVLTVDYPANTAATHTAGFTVSSARDFGSLANATDGEFLAGDSLLLIKSVAGEEWMAWKTITNNGDGTYTIGTVMRGVLDTIPLAHPAGSRVWFVSNGVELLADAPYIMNGNVTAKLLPFNTRGVLPIASATALTVNLAQRSWKPYPAAKLQVDGSATTELVSGDATVTWSIRHRLQQQLAGVVVAQDAANFVSTPEGGYDLKVYINGVLKRTVNITAAPFDTYDYTPAMRVTDDADTTKLVKFGIIGKNGTFSSIERFTQEVFMLDAADPITVTTATLPAATPGVAYSQSLAATGGATPYTWDVTSGTLPSGITLSSGGLLSGTPTLDGTYSFTVRVQGPIGNSDTQALSLQVSADCADYVIPAATGAAFDIVGTEELIDKVDNEVHICNEITNPPNEDPFIANVVSLLHFNGTNGSTTFTDQKGKTWTATGNAQISTSGSEMGGASLLLDGTGDYIETPDAADWDFGSGQFCIELLARFAAAQTNAAFISQWNSATGTSGWALYISGGTLRMRLQSGSTNYDVNYAFTPTIGQRYHIAVSRDASNVVRLFLDGTLVASAAYAVAVNNDSANVRIGALQGFAGTFDLNGRIDEVRVTKGAARYTANFTPPTTAFPDP